MNKLILLGIDTDLSPSTQYALRITSELLEWAPQLRLVLLHVIPTPFDSRPTWGKSIGVFYSLFPTTQQRLQAKRCLSIACTAAQQQGIAPERVELLQRVGMPADEIVRVAGELQVDFIVIGSKEVDAAARALEELARSGLLCCHRVKGEVRYLND